MWDATATLEGNVIRDWETESIPNAHLARAFEMANDQLRALGFDSPDFLLQGWIAYGADRDMLAHGIKRDVINDSSDGIMIWTEKDVQEINRTADWSFSIREALESYENDSSGFYTLAYHSARLFWETCVKENLGIRFSF